MAESSHTSNPVTTVTGLVREIRPWQWYKQGVMVLGIVFSRNLLNAEAWISLLIGVVSFTAVAGATYIFNDINDLEEDRNHPEKQYRPIASGQVPVPVAIVFGGSLTLVGLVAAYSLGPFFLVVLPVYLAQNALYSLYLKQLVFVDVFLSPWLIVSTFLLALVLALGKRRNELEITSNPRDSREVLGEYSKGNLDQLLVMTMATLLMAYSLYTFSRTGPTMMVTIPFAFFGVFRYHHLVHTTDVAGQPEYLLTDRPSIANLIMWGLVAIAVLYNVPELAIEVVR
jgi:4-hydroxybenzoate polyprenyltransferase